jgi:superfamily II DNA/RNA helicase
VPGARIAIGHGQMTETEIEKTVRAFVRGEFDVLVSTTIVENGLDIARANTILIDRAEHFGLAELHQTLPCRLTNLRIGVEQVRRNRLHSLRRIGDHGRLDFLKDFIATFAAAAGTLA